EQVSASLVPSETTTRRPTCTLRAQREDATTRPPDSGRQPVLSSAALAGRQANAARRWAKHRGPPGDRRCTMPPCASSASTSTAGPCDQQKPGAPSVKCERASSP